jgi:predicted dehydrogenase
MKLGIIGTGKIVSEALTAIDDISEIAVMAVFARPHSRARGEELASRYHIPAVYTDYEELLISADIDTVYIGLINSVHYEYAKQALEHGRNVILEKPFTGTLEEAEELFKIARERDLFIFEAITVLHNDVFRRMKESLSELGNIRLLQANYSQYSSRYERYLAGNVDPAFDPECQGGALRDINIYNIHFAAALFGVPQNAMYYPNYGFNGIDTSGVVIMEYDGFKAVCTGAKDSESPCFVMVQGDRGYMCIEGKPNGLSGLRIKLNGEGSERIFHSERKCHRLSQEFIDFSSIIKEKDRQSADYFERETLDAMRALVMCQKSNT